MQKSRDIEDQAAKWLVKLDLDDSPELRAEFQKWLASGPKNHAIYLRLEKGWRRADYLQNVRPLDGGVNENVLDTFPGALSPEVQRARAQRPARRLTVATTAAILVVGLLAGSWLVYSRLEWQVYRTNRGGFQRIALQDGSIALLNTNSELRVRLSRGRRQIELRSGEALFMVAHDTARPFDVKAGDTIVRAVGTAFSVRLREHRQVDVLVTEGRVAIDPPDDSLNSQLAQSIPLPHMSVLTAGETVRVKAHKLQVRHIDGELVNRALAWTKGRLLFDRVTLVEAVAEFNRYNRRQLVIDDTAIADLHISGSFDPTDLDSFVAALATFGIQAIPARATSDDTDAQVLHLVDARARKG
jgi:transmembrane sensor